MSSLFLSIVVGVVFEVVVGILLPEGSTRKISLSVISLYIFYLILIPVLNLVR